MNQSKIKTVPIHERTGALYRSALGDVLQEAHTHEHSVSTAELCHRSLVDGVADYLQHGADGATDAQVLHVLNEGGQLPHHPQRLRHGEVG